MKKLEHRFAGSTCEACGLPGQTIRATRKLRHDVDVWRERTHTANDKNNTLRKERRAMSKQLEKLQKRITEKEQELDEIEMSLREASADLRASHARVTKLAADSDRLTERCNHLERLLAGVRAVAGDQDG